MTFVEVILPLPLDGCFTYSVPSALKDRVGEGMRVAVPFGRNKTYLAIVSRVHTEKPKGYKVKDILSVEDESPVVLPLQLELWRWTADYYMCVLGDVYKASLPSGLKNEDSYKPRMETFVTLPENFRNETALHAAISMLGRSPQQKRTFLGFLALSHWDTVEGIVPREEIRELTREELMNASHCTSSVLKALMDKGLLVQYKKEIGRLNSAGQPHPENIKALSEAQQNAYNAILMSHLKKDVCLLHGVTSSGKTEIYIHLIQRALDRHEQVLFLMPEIALTVQMRERLQRVFGSRLGIYHSKYSDAERVEIWQKQLSDCPYDVILGARSAVMLPFKRLGLVILDEEHESSFKQQDPAPRYHARSVALVLARQFGAKTVLGTATPSMETYSNALSGKYGLVSLTTRYQDIQLPSIEIADMKDLQRRKMMQGPFSPQLVKAVREALDNGRQAILFQNRRGFSPVVECRDCGWVPHCQNCDVSLTYHRNTAQMTCHYCGAVYKVPEKCPCCESKNLKSRGYGTEKIEDMVMQIFPDAKVARMDLDTTRTRNAYERIIRDFAAGRTNLLIGTQMISKGLDFDNVSIVGILDADSMLNYPDFRAYEHAFMMMSQVSGRAGRKGSRGQVILQTRNKDLPIISHIVSNDFESFYNEQCEERMLFRYPPFHNLIYIYLRHTSDQVVEAGARHMGEILRAWFPGRVLGPDKPSIGRVNKLNIRKIMIKLEKGIDMKKVREYLRMAERQLLEAPRSKSLQVVFDVDPL